MAREIFFRFTIENQDIDRTIEKMKRLNKNVEDLIKKFDELNKKAKMPGVPNTPGAGRGGSPPNTGGSRMSMNAGSVRIETPLTQSRSETTQIRANSSELRADATELNTKFTEANIQQATITIRNGRAIFQGTGQAPPPGAPPGGRIPTPGGGAPPTSAPGRSFDLPKMPNMSMDMSGLKGMASALEPVAAAIAKVGRSIFDATANFEKYEAAIFTVTGSVSKTRQALEALQDFAAKTPFTFNQITENYIKLANRGVNVTRDLLTSLGDIAAAQGKDVEQITEAVLDGQEGQYRRFIEFGIKVEQQGSDIVLKMGSKIGKGKDMLAAIQNLAKQQGVLGGMANQAKTLGGLLSTVQDGMEQILVRLGKTKVVHAFFDAGLSVADMLSQKVLDLIGQFEEFLEIKPSEANAKEFRMLPEDTQKAYRTMAEATNESIDSVMKAQKEAAQGNFDALEKLGFNVTKTASGIELELDGIVASGKNIEQVTSEFGKLDGALIRAKNESGLFNQFLRDLGAVEPSDRFAKKWNEMTQENKASFSNLAAATGNTLDEIFNAADKTTGDVTEKFNKLGIDVYQVGNKTFAKFGNAIAEGTNTEEAVRNLGAVQSMAQKASAELNPLADLWISIRDGAKEVALGIYDFGNALFVLMERGKIIDTIGNIVKNTFDVLGSLGRSLSNMFGMFAGGSKEAGDSAKKMEEDSALLITSLKTLAWVVNLVIESIRSAVFALEYLIELFRGNTKEAGLLTKAGDNFKAAWDAVANKLEEVWNTIKGVFANIKQGVLDFAGMFGLEDELSAIFDSVQDMFSDFMNWMGEKLAQLSAWVGESFSWLGDLPKKIKEFNDRFQAARREKAEADAKDNKKDLPKTDKEKKEEAEKAAQDAAKKAEEARKKALAQEIANQKRIHEMRLYDLEKEADENKLFDEEKNVRKNQLEIQSLQEIAAIRRKYGEQDLEDEIETQTAIMKERMEMENTIRDFNRDLLQSRLAKELEIQKQQVAAGLELRKMETELTASEDLKDLERQKGFILKEREQALMFRKLTAAEELEFARRLLEIDNNITLKKIENNRQIYEQKRDSLSRLQEIEMQTNDMVFSNLQESLKRDQTLRKANAELTRSEELRLEKEKLEAMSILQKKQFEEQLILLRNSGLFGVELDNRVKELTDNFNSSAKEIASANAAIINEYFTLTQSIIDKNKETIKKVSEDTKSITLQSFEDLADAFGRGNELITDGISQIKDTIASVRDGVSLSTTPIIHQFRELAEKAKETAKLAGISAVISDSARLFTQTAKSVGELQKQIESIDKDLGDIQQNRQALLAAQKQSEDQLLELVNKRTSAAIKLNQLRTQGDSPENQEKIKATESELQNLSDQIDKVNENKIQIGVGLDGVNKAEKDLEGFRKRTIANKVLVSVGAVVQGVFDVINKIKDAQIAAQDAIIEANNAEISQIEEKVALEQELLEKENERLKLRQEIDNKLAEERIKELEDLRTNIPEAQKEKIDAEIKEEKSKIKKVQDAKQTEASQEKNRIDELKQKNLEAEQEKRKLQREQFDINKAATIANITIQGALAAMQAFASLAGIPIVGVGLGTAAAVAVGALTAVQIGLAAAQPNPYNKGTLSVPGVGNTDSVYSILTPGEAVIPKETNKKYFPSVKAIYEGAIPAEALNKFVEMYPQINNMEAIRNIYTQPNNIQVNLDSKPIVKALNDKEFVSIEIDEGGFEKYIHKANERSKVVDKKLRKKI